MSWNNGKLTMLCALFALVWPSTVDAADGKRIVAEKCAACHALIPPAKEILKDRLESLGPPLHYAANKYRREWLVAWLQKPIRIWPAGPFYGRHVKTSSKGDIIDTATFVGHVALPADQANAAADYLLTLSSKAKLVASVSYAPKTVSAKMGMLNFGKFKGCSACHSDEDGYGGASGPELYTAYRRLKPEYLVSYIRDPQAWQRQSLMPNPHLKDQEVHKLVDYLKLISEKTP